MASSYNRVILLGNLTRDPELRYTQGGQAICNFDLAMNRSFKGSDGALKKETTFIKVNVWGKSGEACAAHLKKGKACLVEGRLQQRSWEDKETGAKRSAVDVVADNVQFLGDPGPAGGSSSPQGANQGSGGITDGEIDMMAGRTSADQADGDY